MKADLALHIIAIIKERHDTTGGRGGHPYGTTKSLRAYDRAPEGLLRWIGYSRSCFGSTGTLKSA